MHQKPSYCASWDLYGKIGFYTGPVLNHYRCMTCFIPTTKSEIICDTLIFVPHIIPIPTINIDTFLRQSAFDIINVVNDLTPTLPFTYQVGDQTRGSLLQLVSILQTKQITNDTLLHLQKCTENKLKQQTWNKIHKNIPHIKSNKTSSQTTQSQQNLIQTKHNFNHDTKLLQSTFVKSIRALLYFLTTKTYNKKKLIPNLQQKLSQFFLSIQTINHIYNNSGKKSSLDNLLQQDKIKWNRALSNEFGRLT